MGGDQKRLKVEESFASNLKGQVEDLKFIVKHLKTDVTCTIESSLKQLKMAVEREIGLLVYSLVEESLKEQVKLKDHLNALQKENSLLIENEGNIMDELARLTLENEKLSRNNNLNENVLKELDELEKLICFDDEINMIKILKGELEASKLALIQEQELRESKRIEYEKDIREKDNQILELNNLFNELKSKNGSILNELEVKKNEINELSNTLEIQEKEKVENEARIRELMEMNSELMDLGEIGKQKEVELLKKQEIIEEESSVLKEEIESLKKAMTAQKIELERSRETLNRERKLSSLKISDLQEQIEELKTSNFNFDQNENIEYRNKAI